MHNRNLLVTLAATLLLPALLAAQEPAAALASADGRVTVNGRPHKPGAPLAAGDEVSVERGEAVIAFSDGSKVRLGAGGRLKLTEKSAAQTALTLLRGRLDAWVHGLAGRRFRVRSGTAVASVRGTVFSVRNMNGNSAFLLYNGELGMTDDFGQSMILSPRQRLETSELGLGRMGSLAPGSVAPPEPDVPMPGAAGTPQPATDKQAEGEPKTEEPAETAPESLPAAETTLLPPPPPTQEKAVDESSCANTVSPSAPCP